MKSKSRQVIETSIVRDLVKQYKFPDPIHITRPTMPRLENYVASLERVWESDWLTKKGYFQVELELRLHQYLGIEHISLFCNGSIALVVALEVLKINEGEVITTPFTFPATPHSLYWNRTQPVFCDIESRTFNMDPNRIEDLISSKTRAILPVHVYGNPCAVVAIQRIAERHGLSVIYDAAHAFSVQLGGRSLLEFGDLSVLSFHATMLFTTGEGGAIVSKSLEQKKRVDSLKNFGISRPEEVIGPEINVEMNELQAAFGLLQLDLVEEEIANRRVLAETYRRHLRHVPGVTMPDDLPGVRHNHEYFPILIDEKAFGMNRDELHNLLQSFNIMTKKYFYPLCSHYPCYESLASARPENLPVAERVALQVLCFPIYGNLGGESVEVICQIVQELHEQILGH